MGGAGRMGFCRTFVRSPLYSSFSSYSNDNAFHAYNFPGPIPETIPSVIFHCEIPPPPGGHPHVPTSVASPTAPAVSLLHSLPRSDLSTASASDITLSGLPSSAGRVPPAAVFFPSPVTSSSSSSSTSLAPLTKPSLRPEELFKLSEIKDIKSYLDMQGEIDYYLRSDDYSTHRSDTLLITDPSKAEASRYWEGQLQVALKNSRMGGSAFFLKMLVSVSMAKASR